MSAVTEPRGRFRGITANGHRSAINGALRQKGAPPSVTHYVSPEVQEISLKPCIALYRRPSARSGLMTGRAHEIKKFPV